MKRKLTYDGIFEVLFYILIAIYLGIGIINSNINYLYSGILTLITLLAPRIIIRITKITIPNILNFLIILFIFLAMFLGKMNNFYVIWWWDLMLHGVSGVLSCVVAYSLFLSFNNYKTKNVKPILIIFFVISFFIAVAGVWEIWEFATDNFFGLNAQDGLQDTMEDIIAGTIGGLALIPFLWRYIKGKGKFIFKDLTEFMQNANKTAI